MNKILFAIVLSIFISACGSNQPAPPPPAPTPAPAPGPGPGAGPGKWTQQQFEGEKQFCIQSSSGYGDSYSSAIKLQNATTSGSAGVTQFCQCVYAAVSQRYTFQEYEYNISQIRGQLCQDQTIPNCEKSAGLSQGGTCSYYGYGY